MPTPIRLLLACWLLLAGAALTAAALDDEAPAEPQPAAHVPAPADDGRPHQLEGWRDMACASCHTAIAEEWSTTLHAQAWIDERYQEAIAKKRRPQSCYGCHIPQPMHSKALGGKPRPRPELTEGADEPGADLRHHGISCISCHLAPDGAMLGPYASSPDAEISAEHASRQHASFTEGAARDLLCISCHRTNVGPVIGIAKDFETARLADKGLSCVGCHMSEVERSAAVVTLADGTERPSPVRMGRSHALQTPRDPVFLAEAFGLEARAAQGGVELVISNQAGHRVPGLKTRSMTFEVSALDATGAVLGSVLRSFDAEAYLPVEAVAILLVETATDAVSVRVRATHAWTGVAEPVVFVERDLPLP